MRVLSGWALGLLLIVTACEGPMGPGGNPGVQGPTGIRGPEGPTGNDGANGQDGQDGQDGRDGKDGVPIEPGDPEQLAYFTDPGLRLHILGAGISPTGTASVTFRITDSASVALDRLGRYTRAPVSLDFVLAALDVAADGPLQYRAFTRRTVTGAMGTASQATAEHDGNFISLGDGRYRYTFVATATGALSRTHAIGVYASRTVDGARAVADATFRFVPDGSAPATTRELVTQRACNACHGSLSAHGGGRQSLELCVLCHSAGTVDPDTGNTVDFRVMVHKIHMGKDLPSVKVGDPYQIIGYRGRVSDFSTVHYPTEQAYCVKCHQGANAGLHLTRPSPEACLSCHDRTIAVFPLPPGYTLHRGGPQPPDTCDVCHVASGGISGITDRHTTLLSDPNRTELELDILRVRGAGPGQRPTIRFRVRADGQPRDLVARPLTALRFTFAGPNTDYARYWQATVQGSGASGQLVAVDAAQGVFDYTPAAGLPSDASGSYTVGMEGYLQASPSAPRYAAQNPIFPFLVTGTATVARRTTIASASCEGCHVQVRGHGDQRLNPQYCAMCHNANNPNDERWARVEGASVHVESTQLKYMIHKIHRGEDLERGFLLYGYPGPSAMNPAGTPVDFSEVRFPGIRGDCSACHAGATYEPPLGEGALPTLFQERSCTEPPGLDGDELCQPQYFTVTSSVYVPPTTAACTGCHDSLATAAHAELNTTSDGREACAVCHGPGREKDVQRVHPILR